ncbi:MAG: hypothetical protein ACRDKL_03650 [Solirubrobacteraceae bacterium]
MPPTDRFVISFAAEPPQEPLPHGRWADTLREHFLAACADIDSGQEEIGEPGEVSWFPDRSYQGLTYVPAVARTGEGYEVFGYVRFREGERGAPSGFEAHADFTADVAEGNPDWKLDLNEMVVGSWRGEDGNSAEMTLVWGVSLVPGGAVVTAELADLAVDQCALAEERFTLLAADNYRGDYLELKLWGRRGEALATESLYVDDQDERERGEDGQAEAGA